MPTQVEIFTYSENIYDQTYGSVPPHAQTAFQNALEVVYSDSDDIPQIIPLDPETPSFVEFQPPLNLGLHPRLQQACASLGISCVAIAINADCPPNNYRGNAQKAHEKYLEPNPTADVIPIFGFRRRHQYSPDGGGIA